VAASRESPPRRWIVRSLSSARFPLVATIRAARLALQRQPTGTERRV
jgi:hypothetical protein